MQSVEQPFVSVTLWNKSKLAFWITNVAAPVVTVIVPVFGLPGEESTAIGVDAEQVGVQVIFPPPEETVTSDRLTSYPGVEESAAQVVVPTSL